MEPTITPQDIMDEIHENLKLLLNDDNSTCSWEGISGPLTSSWSVTNPKFIPPKEFGLNVTVDQTSVHTEYTGFIDPPRSYTLPRLPNGEYELEEDGEINKICEKIIAPLKQLAC